MSDDPTDLKAQEAKAKARATQTEQVALKKVSDWKWLMSQARGRRLIWRLLEETGLYRSSFTGNSETFFREGERNVGLKIVAILTTHCLEDYSKMMVEQRDYD